MISQEHFLNIYCNKSNKRSYNSIIDWMLPYFLQYKNHLIWGGGEEDLFFYHKQLLGFQFGVKYLARTFSHSLNMNLKLHTVYRDSRNLTNNNRRPSIIHTIYRLLPICHV